MTIRLLTRWNDLDANTITTQDAATEAGLIAANMATADLTGGVRRYRAASGPSVAPLDPGQQASVGGSEQLPITVPARCRLFVTGSAGADGSLDVLHAGTDVADQTIKIASGPSVVGPFPDERRVRVASNSGRFDLRAELVVAERNLNSSIMFIGSSTFAAGSALPNLPVDTAVQSTSPTLTPLIGRGDFVQRMYIAKGASRAAGAVLRFYAADSTLTWQAPGDTEGARVKIAKDHMWYTLPSGTPGAELYLETIPSLAPLADASVTFPAPTANLWRYENVSTYSLSGWIQILSGAPFARSVSYCKSSAGLRDMRAAHADWENDYTDITHIYMGTNDVSDLATALAALDDLEFIVRARQAIGSKVIVGGILPRTGRTAIALQAVAHFNLMLRAMGERMGFGVWDGWPYSAKANGDWVDGLSTDNTHMVPSACYMMAKRAVAALMDKIARSPFTPAAPVMAPFDAILAPYGNHIPNAVMSGAVAAATAGVSGTVPTNWEVARGTGTTITAVSTAPDAAGAVALPDGRAGKYWTVAISNANASAVQGESMIIRRPSAVPITTVVPGTLIQLEGEIRVRGTDVHTLTISMLEYSPGVVTTIFAVQGNVSGIGDFGGDTVTIRFRTSPFRATAGLTNVNVNITTALKVGGSAVIDVAPTMNIHNVPENG